MGTWGAALYDDDEAADLKDTIALLSKIPTDGERLLGYLKRMYGDDSGAEHTVFWLATADQFERRGIHCRSAFEAALSVIDSGADLADARARGADAAFLKKRATVLHELAARLRNPRPARRQNPTRKPPALVVETGEIYAFPTMQSQAWHPYRFDSAGPFLPDGWGALVVLDTGRLFDWLPWAAAASLTVAADRQPSLEEAVQGQLITHPQTNGAGRYVPRRAHVRGAGFERLGHVALDPACVAPLLSTWDIATAVSYDWTICYAAIAPTVCHEEPGRRLAEFLA